MNIDFTTREEYLAWKAEWKAQYKELSQEIRDLKASRKQFTWSYRAKDDTASKKKVITGKNPNYNSSAQWKATQKREVAFGMLELLADAKSEAARQRKKSLESVPK